jgi:hypothetical protein
MNGCPLTPLRLPFVCAPTAAAAPAAANGAAAAPSLLDSMLRSIISVLQARSCATEQLVLSECVHGGAPSPGISGVVDVAGAARSRCARCVRALRMCESMTHQAQALQPGQPGAFMA